MRGLVVGSIVVRPAKEVKVRSSVPMLAVLVACSALLCGCSIASSSYRGAPVDDDGELLLAADAMSAGLRHGTPIATKLDDPNTFALTLFGSSTCTAYPSSVAVEGEMVSISTSRPLSLLCSADFAATTYEIDLPNTIEASEEMEFSIDDGPPVRFSGQ